MNFNFVFEIETLSTQFRSSSNLIEFRLEVEEISAQN